MPVASMSLLRQPSIWSAGVGTILYVWGVLLLNDHFIHGIDGAVICKKNERPDFDELTTLCC